LIAAFSACAVSYSALLRGAPLPAWGAYLTAFGVCLVMFLQLRIADEFKDREEDARWRPYRAVPRGLVTLTELRRLGVGGALLQLVLVVWWHPPLAWVLALAWGYFALMSVEFFCRDWLKRRPVVYLLSHMGIMPLVDLFGTACDWLPGAGRMPAGLGWFLAASFCNGIVIEVGRKLRRAADEEEGVETYSRLWGMRGGAAVWVAALAATLGCAVAAAARIGFAVPVAVVLGGVLAAAAAGAAAYARGRLAGGKIEALAGVWTLVLYLMLGLLPLAVKMI
jgi:4-hydroxybenzoate polyprenyltransferase